MIIGAALPAGGPGNGGNAVDRLIRQTKQAATAGLNSVWFSQLLDHDAVSMAALAGRAVPEIDVGTSVVPIYPRHPMLVSSVAQTAQAATGGRFTLGVGLGAKDLLEPAYGIAYPPPIAHLREYLTVLRGLLDDTGVDFTGEIINAHPSLPTRVAGAERRVPVLVAAMGPQALRATGELADGTLPYLAGPRNLAEHIVPAITGAAERAGRPAPRIVAALPAVVTGEVDKTRAAAAEQFAFYDEIPSYQRVLEREGVARAADLMVVGDEETVAAEANRYFEAGATEVIVTNSGMNGEPDRLRTWKLFGELAG